MNIVRVSARAATRFSKLLEKHNKESILFSCKSGGCHGFEYNIEPVKQPKDAELQVLDNGIHFYTCNKSMLYLLGTEIDWADDIMGARFVFSIQVRGPPVAVGQHFHQRKNFLKNFCFSKLFS